MKTFTSLLIGCSLALAGVVLAQQPEESPGKKKKQGAEQTQPAQPKPGANAAKPHATAVREHGPRDAPGATNEPGAEKGRKAHQESATAQQANLSGQPAGSATPTAEKEKMGMKGHAAKTSPAPAATAAAGARATPGGAGRAAPAGAPTGQRRGQANPAAGAKRPPPQQVQQ